METMSDVKDFLESIARGPTQGVSHSDFVRYCQLEAKRLLSKAELQEWLENEAKPPS